MAGYVKIWTTLESDGWFMCLTMPARGLFLQLIIAAKSGDETGTIFGRSYSQMAQRFGCDDSTLAKYLRQFANDGKIVLSESGVRPIRIELCNYLHWQSLKNQKEAISIPKKQRKVSEKSAINRRNQNSSEQNRTEHKKKIRKESSGKPDSPPSDHKSVIEYFCQKHQDKCGIKYHFAGGKDGKLVQALLTTYGREELISLIDRFFQPTGDKFVDTAAKTIGVLNVVVNKLAQLGTDPMGGMNLSDRERKNVIAATRWAAGKRKDAEAKSKRLV